jgi:hypothetical protein
MDKLEIKRALLYNKPRLLWDYALFTLDRGLDLLSVPLLDDIKLKSQIINL